MSWAAATPDSKSFWHLTGVWLALSVTLIFGHITLWAQSAAGAEYRIAGVELFGSPLSAGVSRDPLPPSSDHPFTTYAGTRWSLIETRTVPRANELIDHPVIVVELLAANLTLATPIRVRTSDLALAWPDGRLDEVDRFEHLDSPTGFTLDPGRVQAVTAVFKPRVVVDPVLTEMSLRIGESGRIPAVLPLLGPVLPPSFPVGGRIDGGPTLLTGTNVAERRLIVTPRTAVVDVEVGTYRAALGRKLLLVDLSVGDAAPGEGSSYLRPGFWSLDVGGEVVHPVQLVDSISEPESFASVGSTDGSRVSSGSGGPSAGGTAVRLVFVIPAELADAQLVVTPGGLESARYEIQIP